MRQDGFSLAEVLITCAIAALLVAAVMPAVLGTKPAGAASAELTVEAAIARAQALAATSGNGATVQFLPSASGTTIRLYSGRPTTAGAMTRAASDATTTAAIAEASLGAAPFAVFFDTSGHASATGGSIDPSGALASDPGCPPGGFVAIVVSDARTRATVDVACTH